MIPSLKTIIPRTKSFCLKASSSLASKYILIALAMFTFDQSTASASPKTEWLLEQHHYEAGNAKVYISEREVRINNTDRGFQIVAKAPDWTVEIFRTDQKLVYKTDLDHFEHFSIWGGLSENHGIRNYHAIKMATVKDGALVKTKFFYGAGDIWIADNISQSPQIKRVLTIYNNAPESCVPLYFTMMFAEEKPSSQRPTDNFNQPPGKQTFLFTKKASLVPYKETDFAYPAGYKEVKAYSQLLSRTENKADGAAIIDGFGFSKHTLEESKTKGK